MFTQREAPHARRVRSHFLPLRPERHPARESDKQCECDDEWHRHDREDERPREECGERRDPAARVPFVSGHPHERPPASQRALRGTIFIVHSLLLKVTI